MTLTPQNLMYVQTEKVTFDRRGKKGGHVLLHEHDQFRGDHCPPISRDCQELLDFALTDANVVFGLETFVHVELIASCLDLGEAKSTHALVGASVTTFAHIPDDGGQRRRG